MLYPVDPGFVIEHEAAFLHHLREMGLAGKAFAPGRWLAGERFLSLVTFLGCSPAIDLTPGEGGQFCHLHLPPAQPEPALWHGGNFKPPRCGACGGIAVDRPPLGSAVACRRCGAEQALSDLDWRRSACVARSPLILDGIFESEAVPSGVLLGGLAEFTGVAWDYCYLRARIGGSP